MISGRSFLLTLSISILLSSCIVSEITVDAEVLTYVKTIHAYRYEKSFNWYKYEARGFVAYSNQYGGENIIVVIPRNHRNEIQVKRIELTIVDAYEYGDKPYYWAIFDYDGIRLRAKSSNKPLIGSKFTAWIAK